MTSFRENTERVLTILGNDGPAKAKDLIREKLAQATVYRALRTLSRRRLVTVDPQGVYSITKKGTSRLEARNESMEIEPSLPIDALACAPSEEHRAFLTLGMCAAVSRTFAVADRSLGCFLLVGEPGTFKTTVARALVVMAGGDVGQDVVDAAPESGKGLLIRRDARGDEVSRCRLLSVPVAVFDEAEKVEDPKATNILENAYFSGMPSVNSEGQQIPIVCVPVATMNPVKKNGSTFVELTGWHESRERRVIMARLPKVEIPVEKADEDWFADLVAVDLARTCKLPRPTSPGLKAVGRFMEIIKTVLRTPGAGSADAHVLNNIARGATAWLDEERAVRLVAFNWARLMATNGYCHEDWELRLQLHFAPRAARRARRNARILKRSKPLYRAVKQHLDGDFNRAVEVIEREGTVAQAAPKLQVDINRLLMAAMNDLEGGVSRALAIIEAAVDIEKQGASIDTALELERLRTRLELSRDRALGGLELRARLQSMGVPRATAEALSEMAHKYELSTENAAYVMELGAELAYFGYRFEHLEDLARRAPRRPRRA